MAEDSTAADLEGESTPSCSKRFCFSDAQRKVLVEHYEKGMNSTAKRCEGSIQECAGEIQCTVEQVKVCWEGKWWADNLPILGQNHVHAVGHNDVCYMSYVS